MTVYQHWNAGERGNLSDDWWLQQSRMAGCLAVGKEAEP